jgi:hypothetical protein
MPLANLDEAAQAVQERPLAARTEVVEEYRQE